MNQRTLLFISTLIITLLASGATLADARSDAAGFCSKFTAETEVKCGIQRCPCGSTTTEKARYDRGGVRISVCACVSKTGLAAFEKPEPDECSSNTDCNDGLHCNGMESCRAGQCVQGAAPCTEDHLICNEASKACQASFSCEDADGDGYGATHCGGADCDDGNANRFPGNTEICESRGIDEDCDPTTVGDLDRDGDGFLSEQCR